MYLASVIVLLSAALLNAESNVEPIYEPCDGGYCLPKHFCPTGKAVDILGLHGRIKLRVDEVNECGDFMKICCKQSIVNSVKFTNMNDRCGISNPQGLVYHVVSNLTYAKYAEFPWTVAIFQMPSTSNNAELTHVGGGTLIHPKYILMAAHTLKDSHRYLARFGEWNMKSDLEIYPTQDIEIEVYFQHQLYRQTPRLKNDIALAVLKNDVIYSDRIRPLCLPSAQDVFVGQKCIATGWGYDVRTGKPAPIMKRMEMNVIPRGRCEKSVKMLIDGFELHDSIMCVGAAGDQNTCVKDGGSPLACQRDDGSYVLAGIASWVVGCSYFDIPGGYVDVAKFACWINDTIAIYEALLAEDKIQDMKKPGGKVTILPVHLMSIEQTMLRSHNSG